MGRVGPSGKLRFMLQRDEQRFSLPQDIWLSQMGKRRCRHAGPAPAPQGHLCLWCQHSMDSETHQIIKTLPICGKCIQEKPWSYDCGWLLSALSLDLSANPGFQPSPALLPQVASIFHLTCLKGSLVEVFAWARQSSLHWTRTEILYNGGLTKLFYLNPLLT